MDRIKILELLKQLLKDKYDVDPDSLTGASRQDDIGLDSMTMVDLMMDIETALDFQFPNLNLPRNPSLDDIVELIAGQLGR
ncbi:MAG TPA: phosphopantetheine-binding protein [Arenimonas sp.]|nr:phosphopantetheine-binding protein [Arenimonas sp.]